MHAMRRVLVLILLGAMAGGPGRAALAARNPEFITLTGKRTAYVDVRFESKFKVDEWATKLDFGGRFAGWAMHRLGEPIDLTNGNLTGAYAIKDAHSQDRPYVLPVGFRALEDDSLAPGVYRIYLLADGPTRVQVPITKGAEAMALRPLRPTTARVTAAELDVAPVGVVPRSTNYSPVSLRDDVLAASIVYFHAEPGVTAQDVQACIAKENEGPLQNCEGGGIAGQVLHPTQSYDFSLSTWYEPGTLEAGDHFAFHKVTAATVDWVVGASLTLQLQGS